MFIKKYLRLYLFLFLAATCTKQANAQYIADRMAIHFTSPTGLINKAGGKLEYRFGVQSSILVNYDRYWGFFPGYRAGLEYHHYYQSFLSNHEDFIYGKAGSGYAEYRPLALYSGWETNYAEPGKFLYGGLGVGRRYHFGAFFLEINLGLKATQLVNEPKLEYNKNLFYATGPGSILDCNFHFGLQFLHHKGSVSRITGRHIWRRYKY